MGMASAVAGLLLFSTVGPDTSFFPTIFLACFAIGFGIGNAFMPLLTIAMADVPAADSGLGSGITNVSQQISGALGLAVLSTIAANHTKGLVSAHHGLTTSLISGYHVAFLSGAAVIAAGAVLAFALLRPARSAQPDLQLAEVAPAGDAPSLDFNSDIERTAA
jgi:MFS family permease